MVKTFVSAYNNYISSKARYFSRKEEINKDQFKLITPREITEYHDFHIFNITENYNYDETSIMSELLFFKELQQNSVNENWVAFAEYYGHDWYYTLDVETKEVFLVDTNTNFIQLKCASNEESFINAIKHVFSLEILRFDNNLESINEKIGQKYYEECVQFSGLDKNNMFYRYILGV